MTVYDHIQKAIDLALKCEAHAFLLIVIGVGLKLHHMDDPGLILAGLAIFKGNR